MVDTVTAVIKTFERPECLQRLMQSLRALYPTLPVLIADDGRTPQVITRWPYTTCYALPYDSGLSAGRNFLYERVRTPYTLLLDDDFVFTERTDIGRLHALLERDTDMDIMGGSVWNHPTGYWNYEGRLTRGPEKHMLVRKHWNEVRDGYVVCDIIPNFFMSRTARVLSVKWDPQLKLSEHVDFFVRCLDVLKVGYCEDVCIHHDRGRVGAAYKKQRARSREFYKLYLQKYNFPLAQRRRRRTAVDMPQVQHRVMCRR